MPHTQKFIGIIPARYASTRFPGKSLADIHGKPMIRWVYEQTLKALETVYVATDDSRIYDTVLNFGGKAIMTSTEHQSGTDRCAEAVAKITSIEDILADVVVNIQGDEPFIKPRQIKLLTLCFDDRNVEIATLIRKVEIEEDLFNSNHPKVVLSLDGNAIYFSRSAIPYYRDADRHRWLQNHTYYKHIGIYGYKTDTLLRLTSLGQSSLEIAESLEQNRWLENGFKIRTAITPWESIGIDTPEDLEKAQDFYKKHIDN